MIDVVVTLILVLLVGSALMYIIKSKKNGVKCVGCPSGGNCCSCHHAQDTASPCGSGNSSCGCHTDKN